MQRIRTFLTSLRPTKRSYVVFLLLGIILIVAFLLRFAAFDHPLATNAGEGFRDLFVAKHALVYGEWPLSGYTNGLSTIDNSPFYFYIVTALAVFSPTFLDTGLVYIVFQSLFILLVFFLTRELFSTKAALFASLLLAISPHYVTTASTFIWPPYFAAPFVVLSFLLLWYGYKNKHKLLLGISPVVMLMGLAVHQSVLPIIPLYVLIVLYAAYKSSFSFKNYLIASISFVFIAGTLFIPSILQADLSDLQWGTRLYSVNPVSVSEGIFRTFTSVPYTFGIYSSFPGTYYGVVSTIFLILVVWFFIARNSSQQKKKIYLTLFFLFSTIQIVAAIIIDPEGVPRHFEPILWMLPVILGTLLAFLFEKSRLLAVLSIALLLLFVTSAFSDERLKTAYQNIGAYERPQHVLVDTATSVMVQEIEQIKKAERIEDYTFFDIYGLGNTGFYVSQYIFWFTLEEQLQVELEQSTKKITNKIRINRSEKYIFLACFKHQENYVAEKCIKEFIEDRPQHVVQKHIFSSEDLNIYLTKQNQSVQ